MSTLEPISSGSASLTTTTYEAESLTRTASAAGSNVATGDCANSNCAYVQFNAAPAVNAWIEFTIPSVVAGVYDFKMYFKANNNRGIHRASLDGATLGAPCDEYASATGYQVVCNLGSATLSASSHKIRFTVTGKRSASSGYSMTIDKIVMTTNGGGSGGAGGAVSTGGALGTGGLTSVGGSSLTGGSPGTGGVIASGGASGRGGTTGTPTTYEAENLTRTSSGIGTAVVSDAKASGGAYVQLAGTPAVNDWIEFTIPGAAAGAYDLSMYFKSNNNRGITQAALDGAMVGSACDEYRTTAQYSVLCSLGRMPITAASHRLRFTLTGKNSASAGYTLVIDKIVFAPAGGGGSGGSPGSGGSGGTGGAGGSTGAPDGGGIPDPPPRSFYWSIATANSIMTRWPDFRKAYWIPWSYVNGYVLYGFEMLWRYTGDTRYFDYMKTYIDSFVDAQGNLSTFSGYSLDDMLTGTTLVELFEITHDQRYRLAADKVRAAFNAYPRTSDGGFWHNKSLRGEMWSDGVFMGQLFLGRYGKSVGDSAYAFDEATKQITVYASHAAKNTSGLYYHGWDEDKNASWANSTTGLSPEVWSEGLGWYALVLVETLALLPADHPRRASLHDVLQRLLIALKNTQDPVSGRWYDITDKGQLSDNWTDTSGSAMFTYTIRRAVELGYADASTYAPIAEKGYQGIIANAVINGSGLVDISSACDGVEIQNSYSAYVNYPRVINAKEAVGGFLWATTIMEKPPRR